MLVAQAHVAGAPAANEVDAENPSPRGAQRPGVEGLADLDLQTGLLANRNSMRPSLKMQPFTATRSLGFDAAA